MKWHAELILNNGSVDGFAEQLLDVSFTDIPGNVPNVLRNRLALEIGCVDLARRDDPDLDHLQLPTECPTGIEKPK